MTNNKSSSEEENARSSQEIDQYRFRPSPLIILRHRDQLNEFVSMMMENLTDKWTHENVNQETIDNGRKLGLHHSLFNCKRQQE